MWTGQHLFSPYYTRFLVRSDDLPQVKKDKIKLLLNVLTVDNYQGISREFIVRLVREKERFLFLLKLLFLYRTMQMMWRMRLFLRQYMLWDIVPFVSRNRDNNA